MHECSYFARYLVMRRNTRYVHCSSSHHGWRNALLLAPCVNTLLWRDVWRILTWTSFGTRIPHASREFPKKTALCPNKPRQKLVMLMAQARCYERAVQYLSTRRIGNDPFLMQEFFPKERVKAKEKNRDWRKPLFRIAKLRPNHFRHRRLRSR